jgi:hypothetical protein
MRAAKAMPSGPGNRHPCYQRRQRISRRALVAGGRRKPRGCEGGRGERPMIERRRGGQGRGIKNGQYIDKYLTILFHSAMIGPSFPVQRDHKVV